MFERFTRKARALVVLAQDQAHGSDRIGSEHLLAALVRVRTTWPTISRRAIWSTGGPTPRRSNAGGPRCGSSSRPWPTAAGHRRASSRPGTSAARRSRRCSISPSGVHPDGTDRGAQPGLVQAVDDGEHGGPLGIQEVEQHPDRRRDDGWTRSSRRFWQAGPAGSITPERVVACAGCGSTSSRSSPATWRRCGRRCSAGRSRSGLVELAVHDLRGWTHDVHQAVDDAPYGGGPGMVMRPAGLGRGARRGARRREPARLVVPTPAGPAVHPGHRRRRGRPSPGWCSPAAATRASTSG